METQDMRKVVIAAATRTAVGKFGGSTVRFGASEAPLADLAALYRGAFEAALG